MKGATPMKFKQAKPKMETIIGYLNHSHADPSWDRARVITYAKEVLAEINAELAKVRRKVDMRKARDKR
jgi:hypothetical protein